MNFLKIFKLAKEFLLFNLGSNLSFWFQLGLTILFTEVFKLWYMWSYGIALIIATIGLFLFQQFITFHKGTKRIKRRFIKFTIATIALYIPNWFLVLLVTNWLNKNFIFKYNYILGIFIVSIPYAIIYYIICKEWIFKVSSRVYQKPQK